MDDHTALNRFISQAEVASWPFFAIASIAFGMRSVSRMFLTVATAGWEDLIISLSWALNVVRMVTFQLALNATRKVDQNNPLTLPSTVPNATFWSLFTGSWSNFSLMLPKVGVSILLVRVFHPRPLVKAAILSSSIGLFIVCIPSFIIFFVQCNPIAGQWNPFKYPHTKCWPRSIHTYYAIFATSWSALLDLAFALYPGFKIWRLQLPRWKKISTICLMSLGIAAFAVIIVKRIDNGTLLDGLSLTELYTKTLKVGFWNSIENNLVIIAACLPSTRPLFRAVKSFAETHFTGLKSTKLSRITSPSDSQNSLTEDFEQESLELTHHRPSERCIQVQHETQQRAGPDSISAYKFNLS